MIWTSSFWVWLRRGQSRQKMGQRRSKWIKVGQSGSEHGLVLAVTVNLSYIFSAILNFSAVLYFQVEIQELPPRFEMAWTSIVAWLSTSAQMISAVLCTLVYYTDPLLNHHKEPGNSGVIPGTTMNFPLERYFYGSSRSSSINNFNERWFDERYSQTATNGYIASGVSNNAYNGGIWRVMTCAIMWEIKKWRKRKVKQRTNQKENVSSQKNGNELKNCTLEINFLTFLTFCSSKMFLIWIASKTIYRISGGKMTIICNIRYVLKMATPYVLFYIVFLSSVKTYRWWCHLVSIVYQNLYDGGVKKRLIELKWCSLYGKSWFWHEKLLWQYLEA